MMDRSTMSSATLALALLVAGCGGGNDAGDTTDRTESAQAKAAQQSTSPTLPRTPAPEGARAFIVEPADGATVSSPVKVVFGAENIEVIAAGNDVPGSGHHHLIIDAPLPDFGQPIPKSDQYVHFGGGQTETTIELEPGQHELRLLFGDHLHIPHDPPVYSDVVTITVE